MTKFTEVADHLLLYRYNALEPCTLMMNPGPLCKGSKIRLICVEVAHAIIQGRYTVHQCRDAHVLEGIARLAIQRSIIANGRSCFSKFEIKAAGSFFQMPIDDVLGIIHTLHSIDLDGIEAGIASDARRQRFSNLPKRYQEYEKRHPLLGNHSQSYLADEFGQTYVDLFLAGYYETVRRQMHNFRAYLKEMRQSMADIEFEEAGPRGFSSESTSFQQLAVRDTNLDGFDFYMLESSLITYHTAKVENTLLKDTFRRCGENRATNVHLWNEISRTEDTIRRSMWSIKKVLPELPPNFGRLQVPYLGDFPIGRSISMFKSTLNKAIPQSDEVETKLQNQRFEVYMEQPEYKCYTWHCTSTGCSYSMTGVDLINQYYDTVTLETVTTVIENYEKQFIVINCMDCFAALRFYDAEKFQDEYQGRKWGLHTLKKPIHYTVSIESCDIPPYVPPEARNFHDVHENNRKKYFT